MDLILRGGRVIDPAQRLDATCDVGFANGRVAAVAPRIAETAKDERDVAGAIVTPGMIDLHTHVYWGGTSIGVEAEPIARRSGTTTFVDAGTAGPANFPGFRRHVIEPSAGSHPCLSQRLVRRHLRVQPHGDGGGSVRPAPSRSQRVRARGAREPRSHCRHQGAGGPRRRGCERHRAARHGDRGCRGARLAGDGAHRSSAAESQGGARAPAPRRRAHALLPAIPEFAIAAATARCARKRCSRASAA